ncbi:MAG: type IV pilin protein [Candidatus Avelusimicrobium sp.]|uniref:type IV pilin protein n=1 Tax=Candidatus Avelusimicrobium sp. TaxID=3048833 RepID=UPI003F0FBA66
MKGFTLIELLVVVLIIGILASVALPEYQLAVRKARYAQMVAVLHTFREAEEVYYLANGTYIDDTSALDVGELQGCSSGGAGGMIGCSGKFFIDVNAGDARNNPAAYMADGRNMYVHYQDFSPVKPGERECWARTGDSLAQRLCRSLNGRANGTVTRHSGGTYDVYTLP